MVDRSQMQSKMQDTHRDKLAKMAAGDEQAFRDLFSWASPKFVCSVGSREFYDLQVGGGVGGWVRVSGGREGEEEGTEGREGQGRGGEGREAEGIRSHAETFQYVVRTADRSSNTSSNANDRVLHVLDNERHMPMYCSLSRTRT